MIDADNSGNFSSDEIFTAAGIGALTTGFAYYFVCVLGIALSIYLLNKYIHKYRLVDTESLNMEVGQAQRMNMGAQALARACSAELVTIDGLIEETETLTSRSIRTKKVITKLTEILQKNRIRLIQKKESAQATMVRAESDVIAATDLLENKHTQLASIDGSELQLKKKLGKSSSAYILPDIWHTCVDEPLFDTSHLFCDSISSAFHHISNISKKKKNSFALSPLPFL